MRQLGEQTVPCIKQRSKEEIAGACSNENKRLVFYDYLNLLFGMTNLNILQLAEDFFSLIIFQTAENIFFTVFSILGASVIFDPLTVNTLILFFINQLLMSIAH